MKIGFLFDNDGVLMDSSQLHWLSWQHLMRKERRLVMDHETFIAGFGKRNDTILSEVAPFIKDEERAAWAEEKERLFREEARGRIALLPGMEEFLLCLKKAAIPRIIASSTPIANLQMFLETTVLGDYFSGFVSAEEVAEGKPAPDIFLEAARRLELSPQQCIVIEDSPAGLASGRAAGCFVVALETTHKRSALVDYDMIVQSPKELRLDEILENFKKWIVNYDHT